MTTLGHTPAQPGEPEQLFFQDDGRIPNSRLPVLIYHDVALETDDKAAALEEVFAHHGWSPLWRAGIFDYQHYHSTAHEALGVATGHARVILGGEAGQELTIQAGDVVVLPAGTGHCRIEQSDDFLVVGAYPHGQENYDIQRASEHTHAESVERIAQVALPTADPLAGRDGPLAQLWHIR